MIYDQVLILCNGEPPGKELLFRHWNASDLQIAADGGANFLESHGLKPKIIIGDLDSLNDQIRSGVSPDSIVHVEEQQSMVQLVKLFLAMMLKLLNQIRL